ncbi:MAG: hypothetical protein IE881_08335 [Epsilonproteobacteria bacterium]|nr:hypothetical protein [Campylobacterota bacterium]
MLLNTSLLFELPIYRIDKETYYNEEDTFVVEVGGKTKSYNQIKDMPKSYIVSDDIEIGSGNKIPLWLFGFLH